MNTTDMKMIREPWRWLGHPASLVAVLTVLATSGCGTTSSLKPFASASLDSLRQFSSVSVLDFADGTPKQVPEKEIPAGMVERILERGRHFADLIAFELTRTGTFEKVSRVKARSPARWS